MVVDQRCSGVWLLLMISGSFLLAGCSVTSTSPTLAAVEPSAIVSISKTPVPSPLATPLLTSPHPASPIDVSPSSTVSGTHLLTAQAAITAALKLASQPYVDLGGATQPPTNIQATPLRLKAVPAYLVQQGWPEHTGDLGTIADSDVWVVTMEGRWQLIGGPAPEGTTPASLIGGPAPEGTTPAAYLVFHHYAIILNAKTGQDMGVFARL